MEALFGKGGLDPRGGPAITLTWEGSFSALALEGAWFKITHLCDDAFLDYELLVSSDCLPHLCDASAKCTLEPYNIH